MAARDTSFPPAYPEIPSAAHAVGSTPDANCGSSSALGYAEGVPAEGVNHAAPLQEPAGRWKGGCVWQQTCRWLSLHAGIKRPGPGRAMYGLDWFNAVRRLYMDVFHLAWNAVHTCVQASSGMRMHGAACQRTLGTQRMHAALKICYPDTCGATFARSRLRAWQRWRLAT